MMLLKLMMISEQLLHHNSREKADHNLNQMFTITIERWFSVSAVLPWSMWADEVILCIYIFRVGRSC
jgi:hypothetical protein